jgi:UDP-3-O-[3-hydroxymyristoyl] N-acetylglucosamine deacetylase
VPLRIESECAAHKILDLLGDLALAGPLPAAHYICVRGGHWLHLKLAARLRQSVRKK